MWQDLREELHPRGVEIVTVALDVDAEAAKPFIEAANPSHPSLIDQGHVVDERFGVVNVPNGVWIDEEGVIVRPAEPAFPGRTPIQQMGDIDVSTLPEELRDVIAEAKKIKIEPERYKEALLDWVQRGSESRYALSPDEVVARSHARDHSVAEAAAHFELGQHLHRAGNHAAAIPHWRQAHRLQPDNWTYRRQAWNFEDPGRQGHTDAYDSSWIEDVRNIGAENYYPPFVP